MYIGESSDPFGDAQREVIMDLQRELIEANGWLWVYKHALGMASHNENNMQEYIDQAVEAYRKRNIK